ncbi:hypothetical protein KCP74_08990 [Salmonella enterica subsp. enterica]|nr:hypothetical protein KCP74_08990 [Salmonella enterica subsp. enterica]
MKPIMSLLLMTAVLKPEHVFGWLELTIYIPQGRQRVALTDIPAHDEIIRYVAKSSVMRYARHPTRGSWIDDRWLNCESAAAEYATAGDQVPERRCRRAGYTFEVS